jgi:chromosomal replication initiator protein
MEKLLQRVQDRIGGHTDLRRLECWLEDVTISEDAAGNLVVACPNRFSMQWLSERHKDLLAGIFKDELGREVDLTFKLSDRSSHTPPSRDCEAGPSLAPASKENTASSSSVRINTDPTEILASRVPFPEWNSRFRFSTFVRGRSNGFAFSAAEEISRQFCPQYNPLFLNGSTGLGKTHLGQAIGHGLFQRDPRLRILCRTAEGFLSEMIRHIKQKNILSFKERYRESCDVLILDDIQFLRGKGAPQSELCSTLDILLRTGKQVVLLGNLPARNANGLEESLDSRIFSGLAVSLEMPDYETRLAILNQLAHSSGLHFSNEAMPVLAGRVRSHVRDLEGAFKRLTALHTLFDNPIDTETVEQLFPDSHDFVRRAHSPRTIMRHVARYFGVSPEQLASRSRKRTALYPRQVAMYLSRKHTYESLETIASLYKKDHTSVLYAIRSLEKKMAATARISREVHFIEQKLLEEP